MIRLTRSCVSAFVFAMAVSAFAQQNPVVQVPAAPEDGGPRTWSVTGVSGVLNLREEATGKAKIIAGYRAGTLLNNLGCLRADGRVWCDVQELVGGPRGYVAAQFLTPAVSPDGSVATGADTSEADGYGEFRAEKQSDLNLIRVGNERYEIPDAIALGG